MRRSSAPSMRKAKEAEKMQRIFGQDLSNEVSSTTEAQANKSFTSNKSYQKDPVVASSKESPLKGKVLFRIVWRELSKKKHKTWKGDGSLEYSLESKQAVLKDGNGKFICKKQGIKMEELGEGAQLVVGNKEIELMEQIKNDNEYWSLWKEQMTNRAWGEEEKLDEPEEKKPKGSFVLRQNIVMPKLQMPHTAVGSIDTIKRLSYAESGNRINNIENDNSTKEPNKHYEKSKPRMQNIDKYDYGSSSSLNLRKINESVEQIDINPTLAKHLRPHQREGVHFIYACLMGLQSPNHNGCILADDMGLGKTLQCLTVAHTMLKQSLPNGKHLVERVLIVTPSSLVKNWNLEIDKWLRTERMFAFIVDGKHKLRTYAKQRHVPFVIVSYETLLAQVAEFEQLKFDLLICDEAHRLKNPATKIVATLNELHIQKRLLLTGTPIQNDLQEFYALADFANSGIFGTSQEFRQHFEIPLRQSQAPDASKEVMALAEERTTELNSLAARFILRRLQDLNQKYLPQKREYICFVMPSELQEYLLQKALDLYKQHKETLLRELNPLQIINVLQKICNHPSLIARTKNPNAFTRRLERHLPDWSEMSTHDSAKLELVQHFLVTTAVQRREKCVLVSNHTKALNILQGLCDFLNINCLRLDGSTPITERNAFVKQFNEPLTELSTEAALVFLLSAKAGGMGLNLIGASRLILYDSDWNPAVDAQAMSRIWRDGQQNNVQIYRLITAGSIEEKIFQRQIAKLTLGDCVMQQTKSNESIKFSAEELQDLFTLQKEFATCQTHESLNCTCQGDGQNTSEINDSAAKQINELLQWQHFGAPFDMQFLEEACLTNAGSNLLYIFSHQTQYNEV